MNITEGFVEPECLYKFTNRKYVENWTDFQCVRISSNLYFAREYREMEIPDSFIFDPHEGRVILNQTYAFSDSDATVAERQVADLMLRGLGPLRSGMHLEGNVVEVTVPEFHMLCFAHGSFDELKEVFQDEQRQTGDPYDAALRISSATDLASLLFRRGVVHLTDKDEYLPVREVFTVGANYVQYSDIVRDWRSGLPIASPYIKDRAFCIQSEFRIVFNKIDLNDGYDQEHFVIYAPNLRDLVEVMEI